MAQTAYGCLEDSHWAVAQAAMEMAEAVERCLNRLDAKEYIGGDTTRRLRRTLIEFREAAARPA